MIQTTIGRRNLPKLECLETNVTSLLRHSSDFNPGRFLGFSMCLHVHPLCLPRYLPILHTTSMDGPRDGCMYVYLHVCSNVN